MNLKGLSTEKLLALVCFFLCCKKQGRSILKFKMNPDGFEGFK